jgi:hypothetical protein
MHNYLLVYTKWEVGYPLHYVRHSEPHDGCHNPIAVMPMMCINPYITVEAPTMYQYSAKVSFYVLAFNVLNGLTHFWNNSSILVHSIDDN